MSKSPHASESPTEDVQLYRDSWSALSSLIGQGKSFSGREKNRVFLNTRDDKFAESSSVFALDFEGDGRAVATCDWNQDGSPDIWLTNRTGPRTQLLLNRPTNNNWLQLRLQGRQSNRDAIGTRVTVTTDTGLKLSRTVRAGDGFLAQSSKWLHFGLGDMSINEIEIRWPNGNSQSMGTLAINRHYLLVEGGAATEWNPPTNSLANSSQSSDSSRSTFDSATRTWIMGRVPLVDPHYLADGEEAATDDFMGKPLLVSLWSKDCPSCWNELAEWTAVQERFQKAQCNVLALSVDSLADEPSTQLNRINWPFTEGEATTEFVRSLEIIQRTFLEWQEPLPLPCSFLLDEVGAVACIYKGSATADTILADVALLNESPHHQRAKAVPFTGRWASEVFPKDVTKVVRSLDLAGDTHLVPAYLERFIYRNKTRDELINATARLLVARFLKIKDDAKLSNAMARFRKDLPESSMLHRTLANLLLSSGKPALALPHFELALALAPPDFNLIYNAGLAAMANKNLPLAVSCFEQCLSLKTNDESVQYHLGNAYVGQGKHERALAQYLAAIEKNPEWALPANNAAWLLATSSNESVRDGTRALQIIRPYCKDWRNRKPVPDAILGTYVAALAESGDFEEALLVNELLLDSDVTATAKESIRERHSRLQLREPIRTFE